VLAGDLLCLVWLCTFTFIVSSSLLNIELKATHMTVVNTASFWTVISTTSFWVLGAGIYIFLSMFVVLCSWCFSFSSAWALGHHIFLLLLNPASLVLGAYVFLVQCEVCGALDQSEFLGERTDWLVDIIWWDIVLLKEEEKSGDGLRSLPCWNWLFHRSCLPTGS
jgi:hypothetical protein